MNRLEFLIRTMSTAALAVGAAVDPLHHWSKQVWFPLRAADTPVFSANPAFSPDLLGETKQSWYERMWFALNDPDQYPAVPLMASGS